MATFKGVMESKVFRITAVVVVALAVLVLIFGLAAGCSSNSGNNNNPIGNPGGPGANEVWMQNTQFNPSSKTVSVGTMITWTNKDGIPHTVTSGAPGSPNGTFDSGNMAGGATFTHTFSQAGTFPYYCRIHGVAMTGSITVQ
ncbi:MAG TPA: plastocyanin/azurin family copper-binding protein [bacterium]|jgi:plastocyanin